MTTAKIIMTLQPFAAWAGDGFCYFRGRDLATGFPLASGLETGADRNALVALTAWIRATDMPRLRHETQWAVDELRGIRMDAVSGVDHLIIWKGVRDPQSGRYCKLNFPYHPVSDLIGRLKPVVFLMEEGVFDIDVPYFGSRLKGMVRSVEAFATDNTLPTDDDDIATALDLLNRALCGFRWSVVRTGWIGAVIRTAQVRPP